LLIGIGGWKTLVLAVVGAVLATEAADATLSVTRVERPGPGLVRIRLRYTATSAPAFRLVPACGGTPTESPNWLVPTSVRLDARRHEATLDLADDLGWLADTATPCRATRLAVELVEERSVTARAQVPIELPPPRFVLPPEPPAPEQGTSRLGLGGQKQRAPQTRMSQAGVFWSFTDRLALHLSYERTAFAPTMSRDHDDGVLTGLRVRF